MAKFIGLILGGLTLASFALGAFGLADKCTMETLCTKNFSNSPQTASFVIKTSRARLNRGEVRLYFAIKSKDNFCAGVILKAFIFYLGH